MHLHDISRLLGRVPERCNDSIPGINVPYSSTFIPGIELLNLSGTGPWSLNGRMTRIVFSVIPLDGKLKKTGQQPLNLRKF